MLGLPLSTGIFGALLLACTCHSAPLSPDDPALANLTNYPDTTNVTHFPAFNGTEDPL